MTSTSRRYYEMELGAGVGPSPGFTEMFGYSEPLRRFIQREGFEPQANEIPNTMPSWMPGEDYYTNFRKGDPFIKVDQGFARLPGAGYEALHPELEGLNPEDYPDINKMAILADVAPYSREYNNSRLRVGAAAKGNTETQIEYEKILDRVRQTKKSVIRMADRHFTAPVDEIEGTVNSVSPGGVTLKEFPGRQFQFSSVGMSAADMSARILGEQNHLTRADAAKEVDNRRSQLRQYLADTRSFRPAQPQKPRAGGKAAQCARSLSVHRMGSRPFLGRGRSYLGFLCGGTVVDSQPFRVSLLQ
jgi:hypothetical protein